MFPVPTNPASFQDHNDLKPVPSLIPPNKYISISNKNPTTTIETNIIGSYNLIKMAKKYNVKEMVGISTDKALNPMNIYGMTKKIMEELFIEAGFTIVSGVNFFGSSGSVLDIWQDQILQKKLFFTNL